MPRRFSEHLALEEENDLHGILGGEDLGVGLGLHGCEELGMLYGSDGP
jgi:hypothetical protein